MKRILALATLPLVALLVAGAATWDRYFDAPPGERTALPGSLIALDSAAGQRLLAQSTFVADYARLRANFVPQSRRAYCGVASSVMTLNALRNDRPRLDQATFFTRAATTVRDPLRVSLTGMSLSQLGELLRAHGASAQVTYAAATTLDEFRAIARGNLRTAGDFVLVNYQRAALGQGEIGHISPLAAYNAGADRFLILDVAAHKYPPTWVSTADLWKAMSAPAGKSPGRTRGFVVVREGTGHTPVRAQSTDQAAARIRLQADANGEARIAMFDAQGKVTFSSLMGTFQLTDRIAGNNNGGLVGRR